MSPGTTFSRPWSNIVKQLSQDWRNGTVPTIHHKSYNVRGLPFSPGYVIFEAILGNFRLPKLKYLRYTISIILNFVTVCDVEITRCQEIVSTVPTTSPPILRYGRFTHFSRDVYETILCNFRPPNPKYLRYSISIIWNFVTVWCLDYQIPRNWTVPKKSSPDLTYGRFTLFSRVCFRGHSSQF